MQKKRKFLWISISLMCTVLLALGVVAHFVFMLKNVNVEFQSRLTEAETNLESGIQAKVKTYFESNDNIILMKFDDSISLAEKENPYLKINKVVKVFPNTIRVYISERIPKFKVKNSENPDEWLILDEDFKVLNKINSNGEETSKLTKYIEISNKVLSVTEEVGNFVTTNQMCKDYVNEIAVGVYGVSEDYSIVKSVTYKPDGDDVEFCLVMKNIANEDEVGCNIILKGSQDLTRKAFAGIKAFEDSLSDGSLINDSSSTITVLYDDGKLVAIKN